MAKLGDQTDFSYRVNKVTKVVDGDTIDVIIDLGFDIMYKSRVRLFGIDTPESRTRDLVEKKYGLMSKDFLKDKLKNAEKIVIKTHKGEETGKFGRNQQMCDVGHAVAYYGQSKDSIQEEHLKNRKILGYIGLE